ncbi:MAG: regulatory protein RecX [Oscillospiraceae bacterium]|nr:regulatory protein RecX [Oscillospiraceae bacterium]
MAKILSVVKRTVNTALVRYEGGSMELPLQTVRLEGLRAGEEVDSSRLEMIKSSSRGSLAMAKAAGYVSSRAMSKKELEQKLLRMGETQQNARDAADRMEELGAIDEEDYALSIVRSYSARGYGPGRVKEELHRRGIPRDLWDSCLESLPDTGELVDRYLRKHLADATDSKQVKKAADALYRRGFSWEDIRSGLTRAAEDVFWEDE